MKLNPKFSAPALIFGLLTLGACNQPATLPTTQPVTQQPVQPSGPITTTPIQPTRSLGLYELRINGVGTQSAQASIERAGFSAQAAEVSGLSYAYESMSNVVDVNNRVVHMTASFKVTNNGSSTISVPTFIPVDTDGAYATDGATPFRNVKSRTGAPVSAAGMRIEPSFHKSGSVVQQDPAATPLRSNLDTGALQLTLPANTVAAGISHQGWQTKSLAPGESTTLDLAAQVPLKSSTINEADPFSDADPFSFSLVFAVADAPAQINLTNIATIQGSTPSGDASTRSSGAQTVEGVVTADLRSGSLQGFYLQEEGIDADNDVNTSDGIFVYCGTSCGTFTVNVGDRVRVVGTPSEFVTATQLDVRSGSVTPLATGVGLPAPATITLPLDYNLRERYEGMRVSATGVVTGNFTLGRGGSFDIADARIPTFTQVNAPSVSGNQAYQQEVRNRIIRIDDGTRAQNPENLFGRDGQPLSASNTLRGGDTAEVVGVLAYSNDGYTGSGSLDTYRIHAQQADVKVTGTNPRPSTPEAVGGTLRVGSMNVLNYFTALDGSNTGCTVNGTDANSRGANNCQEFERQQTKIVKAITTLNPDVLGLLEIQNDFAKGQNSSIAYLVRALNAEAGAGTYAYIDPKTNVGGDAISVAMIYKVAAVDPVGKLATLDNSFDAQYVDTCNRPSWAQTFQSKANGGRFTAVMMHLKSKGSACSALGDSDQLDGQGNAWKARAQAASVLTRWLATNPTGVTEDDRILMGDFNAYAAETPLQILADGGYKNLFTGSAYSYQFDSQWGSLDHAVASSSLAAQVTGQTKWHINADEPAVLDYNTEFKSAAKVSNYYEASPFRSSDHDPVLVGLNLTAQEALPTANAATATLSATPVTVQEGNAGSSTVTLSTQNYAGAAFTISTSNTAGLTVTAPATANANSSFTVTVTAPAGTAAGTYPVTVTANGDGGLVTSTTLNVTVTSAGTVTPPNPPATGLNHLILSQVYGGGGNTKAVYKNDFIELFNPTASDIDLNGYSVEYFSSKGNSGGVAKLSGIIKAGGYFLIQEAAGSAGTQALPTPDLSGTLNMSATAGSVSLTQGGTTVDLVGYGSAAKFEGAATPALSDSNSAQRVSSCVDTDNNQADFTVTAAAPRNSAAPAAVCQP